MSGDETRLVGSIDPRTNRAGAEDQGRRAESVRGRRRWRTCVGIRGGRRARLADRPGARPPLALDRRGRGSYLPGLRRRGDLDCELPRWHRLTHRRGDERGRIRSPVGAVQSLAAGDRTAWVSTAGATLADGMPESCGRVMSGGRDPDVLIASDLPLQGDPSAGTAGTAAAIELVLKQRGFKAGRYTLGYRSCDDSTAQAGTFDRRACAANANAYGRAERLVAVIGTYNSDCAMIEIPILNRAPGGPVGMISPANTYSGLTRRGHAGAVGLSRRAERLLSDRRSQLRAAPAARRHPGHGAGRPREAAPPEVRVHPRRRLGVLERPADRPVPLRGAPAGGSDRGPGEISDERPR